MTAEPEATQTVLASRRVDNRIGGENQSGASAGPGGCDKLECGESGRRAGACEVELRTTGLDGVASKVETDILRAGRAGGGHCAEAVVDDLEGEASVVETDHMNDNATAGADGANCDVGQAVDCFAKRFRRAHQACRRVGHIKNEPNIGGFGERREPGGYVPQKLRGIDPSKARRRVFVRAARGRRRRLAVLDRSRQVLRISERLRTAPRISAAACKIALT